MRLMVSQGIQASFSYPQVIHKLFTNPPRDRHHLGLGSKRMTNSLQSSRPQMLANLVRFAGLLTTLALVSLSPGCASHRPAPLLVEHQVTTLPTNTSQEELSLKLVTYNIWGLPSWMTGAPKGRYPK